MSSTVGEITVPKEPQTTSSPDNKPGTRYQKPDGTYAYTPIPPRRMQPGVVRQSGVAKQSGVVKQPDVVKQSGVATPIPGTGQGMPRMPSAVSSGVKSGVATPITGTEQGMPRMRGALSSDTEDDNALSFPRTKQERPRVMKKKPSSSHGNINDIRHLKSDGTYVYDSIPPLKKQSGATPIPRPKQERPRMSDALSSDVKASDAIQGVASPPPVILDRSKRTTETKAAEGGSQPQMIKKKHTHRRPLKDDIYSGSQLKAARESRETMNFELETAEKEPVLGPKTPSDTTKRKRKVKDKDNVKRTLRSKQNKPPLEGTIESDSEDWEKLMRPQKNKTGFVPGSDSGYDSDADSPSAITKDAEARLIGGNASSKNDKAPQLKPIPNIGLNLNPDTPLKLPEFVFDPKLERRRKEILRHLHSQSGTTVESNAPKHDKREPEQERVCKQTKPVSETEEKASSIDDAEEEETSIDDAEEEESSIGDAIETFYNFRNGLASPQSDTTVDINALERASGLRTRRRQKKRTTRDLLAKNTPRYYNTLRVRGIKNRSKLDPVLLAKIDLFVDTIRDADGKIPENHGEEAFRNDDMTSNGLTRLPVGIYRSCTICEVKGKEKGYCRLVISNRGQVFYTDFHYGMGHYYEIRSHAYATPNAWPPPEEDSKKRNWY